jgi:transcription elongation factor
MHNFTAIRNGLLDHALGGKMSPFDFGLYVFLIMRASYSTGIYEGCALTIACQFGDPSQKEHVQKSLRRLRDRKYINYRNGDGSRGAYPILINKFSVTVGELSGCRLNAWKYDGLPIPEYERQNGEGTVEALSWHGGGRVVAPNKDLKTEDGKDLEDKTGTRKRAAPFEPPTLQQVADFCRKRKNSVNPEKWMAHYQSNGWKVGRNAMKDWKAAIVTWETPQTKGPNNANRAERRQTSNLAARDEARASLMGGR